MEIKQKYFLPIVTAAAIAASGAGFSAYAVDSRDLVIRGAKVQGIELSSGQIDSMSTDLDKDRKAKKDFEKQVVAEEKKLKNSAKADKAKPEGGNEPKKGFIDTPTAHIDSVLNAYSSKYGISKFDSEIKKFEAEKKGLIKSPVIDSLDSLIKVNSQKKADLTKDYDNRIKAIDTAMSALTEVTAKYMAGNTSKYKRNADGLAAYRNAVKVLSEYLNKDIKDSTMRIVVPDITDPKWTPTDKKITEMLQRYMKANIEANLVVDGDPGKYTAEKINQIGRNVKANLEAQRGRDVVSLENNVKQYELEKGQKQKSLEEKNKEALVKINTELASVYALAGEEFFKAVKDEVKNGKRKDVANQLLTAAIGSYAQAVETKSNVQFQKRLEDLKRFEGNVESIPSNAWDNVAGKVKPTDYSDREIAKITTLGATAPYILFSDRLILPRENTHFTFGDYSSQLKATADQIMLAMRIPIGKKLGFLADGSYTPEGASADIDGNKIGKRSSDDFKVNGGLEGNFDVAKNFRIGAKGVVGLDHYSQKVNRTNEPGVDRELTRDNVLSDFELAMKYAGNAKFRAGFTLGYNSSKQFSESTKNGPAGSLGTDATDYMREFSGSIPFELTFAKKVNVLAEPEIGLRAYNFLENIVEGREFGWGGTLGINMDKWSLAGRGFNYPGSGERGDIIASVAPFKDLPVTFTGAYGMSKLYNSETPDLTRENKGYEFALGVMFGGTVRDLYDRLKSVKIAPKKQ